MASSSASSFPPSSSSSSQLDSSNDHERPNIESIRAVVATINQHMYEFLQDFSNWKYVKLKCTSKLNVQKREFFEFSEHSILSNLYWGIESIEAAMVSRCPEEKSSKLKNSESMLQVPALLDEDGVTAGISNRYLVCCSYFYLSVLREFQGDEWQVAQHFLQAILVSPQTVRAELAPKMCSSLFLMERRETAGGRGLNSAALMDFDENQIGEVMTHMARRYKAWLTYYQVMSYGEGPQKNSGQGDIASGNELPSFVKRKSAGLESSNLEEGRNALVPNYHKTNEIKPMWSDKVHPIDLQEHVTHNMAEQSKVFDIVEFQENRLVLTDLDQVHGREENRSLNVKRLQDMLIESQSDAPIFEDSCRSDSTDDSELEVYADDWDNPNERLANTKDPPPGTYDRLVMKQDVPYSTLGTNRALSLSRASSNLAQEKANEKYITNLLPRRCYSLSTNFDVSILDLRGSYLYSSWNYQFPHRDQQGHTKRSKKKLYSKRSTNEICLPPGKCSELELIGILKRAISRLCFSEGLGRCDEDYTVEVVKMYEMLSTKSGVKYTMVKDMILDQLLQPISTSKEVGVIRASISILSFLILRNKAVIEDVNKNGLQLCNLASALKRNVHEAAILIYLISPPPAEIKTLELLPTLVEVVCNSKTYKAGLKSLLLTPPVASLMIIEVLVTAFDYATNNMHLAAITSPRVLSGLLDVPRNNNLEDFTSLATILVRCIKFDQKSRKYISKNTPVVPFISLLVSNQEKAKLIALEFFHEILCVPRPSATNLLQQMRKEGGINLMHALLLLIQHSQPEHKLLAANLLFQLDLLEDSPGKSTYREEALETLLKGLTAEGRSARQQLSAFLLSNLGGTYSWTGEPCIGAWLLKKTGLTSQHHRNMIRNLNWADQSLQDSGADVWSSKTARIITKIGKPLFHALVKGLKSNIKKVSRDCLTAMAWIGCEISRAPDNLRSAACEILLNTVEQFLHPGLELEERLLACLCIYNYASGKGMQKYINFSEGVKESLRRLSGVTWMAEELIRVANYILPNKWRISCVHTQILEASHKSSGAVTALIYYKGQLCSGYADGSIKVWDIEGQTATLVLDVKEHKKAVTCFALLEAGDCLLSGSADKTIRIWQMVQRKLECIELLVMKEPVQSLDIYGQLIFAVTQARDMKVLDASRTVRDVFKAKNVKCVRVTHGKAYAGCADSSIQELSIANNREREMRAPSRSWRIQSRSINLIAAYKDWLYTAGAVVEGSHIKEWRRQSKPQMSINLDRGAHVLAMEVVEDFIYLNCSSSTSTLQIWLRGTQQKVGRLSAGSKITSLFAGNDILFCGTETGLIKGWIPL
ncbi:[Myosin heavy-chain] kinase [Bertholletia excelsa]